MKKIYIIISNSGSLFSKFLKFFTKEKYVHVALSFDKSLTETYSFGRKYPYIPIPAGLINENYNKSCKYFNKSISKIYDLDITDEQYNKIMNDINNNYLVIQKKFKYNYLGLIYLKKNKIKHRKYHFVCTQFCAKVLIDNNIINFDKDYSLVKPIDFITANYSNLIFEGNTLDYLKRIYNNS